MVTVYIAVAGQVMRKPVNPGCVQTRPEHKYGKQEDQEERARRASQRLTLSRQRAVMAVGSSLSRCSTADDMEAMFSRYQRTEARHMSPLFALTSLDCCVEDKTCMSRWSSLLAVAGPMWSSFMASPPFLIGGTAAFIERTALPNMYCVLRFFLAA